MKKNSHLIPKFSTTVSIGHGCPHFFTKFKYLDFWTDRKTDVQMREHILGMTYDTNTGLVQGTNSDKEKSYNL